MDIKIRVWDKNKKAMIDWENIAFPKKAVRICSGTNKDEEPHVHLIELFELVSMSGGVAMVSSGLPSQDGREIYIGDICEQIINGETYIGEMVFDKSTATFGLITKTKVGKPKTIVADIKVGDLQNYPRIIGNIYKNPELLNKI